ncbi:tetratricopeptide repeat protein [Acidovorax sp. sic0104]|uniref:tetratricopeptide repeat protein n=1 Tax=Acidovorax sp. sic0104 TaxID=2854784 RepID=UPI001C44A842|nr:tetratricopeptide repeat protein [Acidovorax sp. sic0104]MBV7541158.1 tetratricopeptide repeat protein [Acidovorax sp. sic0104]
MDAELDHTGNDAFGRALAPSNRGLQRLQEATPHELFAQALENHLAGRLAQAQEGYRQTLQQSPGHSSATHFLGVALHQSGRHDEGVALVRTSLQAEPRASEWHNTLGNMMSALGRHEEAAAAFLSALTIKPRDAVAWNNLGASLLRQGCLEDAIAALRNAIDIDPGFRDALCNLGDALTQAGDPHAAALCYCAEYVLHPVADTERRVLGLAYAKLGRHDDAAQVYEAWLAEEPDHPIAQHLLQASTGRASPEGASQAYLQAYFDDFADGFESKLLGNLEYRVPVAIGHELRALGVAPRSLQVLDAGCGTGLCGIELRPFARHLTGVDLSAKALAKAGEKSLYDALHHQEIAAYLTACAPESFDMVAAADTLIYFGGIEGFAAHARRVLVPGGWLVASFEEWTPQDPSKDGDGSYRINDTGRYSHQAGYVRECLSSAGFAESRIVRLNIRHELGRPVPGMLVIARVQPR